jgi:hypothetical protein
MTATSAREAHDPVRSPLQGLADDLRQDLAKVRGANARLREAESAALRAYADQVEAIVDTMEHDLAERRAELNAERQEHITDVRAALERIAQRTRQAFDELRVQEALAEREVHDAVQDRWDQLRSAVARLQGMLHAHLEAAAGDHDTRDTRT